MFLGQSLSMSRYEVVARRAFWAVSGVGDSGSFSSMTIHSELPVSGLTRSWNWELIARVRRGLR